MIYYKLQNQEPDKKMHSEKEYLEDEFSQHSFAQVQGSVNDHGAELDEQHHQEGLRYLVL